MNRLRQNSVWLDSLFEAQSELLNMPCHKGDHAQSCREQDVPGCDKERCAHLLQRTQEAQVRLAQKGYPQFGLSA
ncbi:MAG: hypothetical protein RRB13_13560 [bacterium]|nr:hypothetical protein [bacterium]